MPVAPIPFVYRPGGPTTAFLHAARSPNRGHLTLLPHNRPGGVEPFVCFLAIRSPADYDSPDEFQSVTIASVEAEILQAVRRGRAIIAYDFANEGGPSIKGAQRVESGIRLLGLPPESVVFITQNRALTEVEQSCRSVRFLAYDSFIKHLAARINRELNLEAWSQEEFVYKGKNVPFLCLNATPRPERILTLAALRHAVLLERGLYSFHGFEHEKGLRVAGRHEHSALIEAFPDLEHDVQAILQHPPVYVDSVDLPVNRTHLALQIDTAPYKRTWFSIVTESEMTDGRIVRATEKTIKALAFGHPVVVFGNPGTLAIARQLGFDTFSDVIPDGYDTVLDPAERFTGALESVKLACDVFSRPVARGLVERMHINHEFGRTKFLDHYLSH